MKTIIVGAGAIGSLFGYFLAKAGKSVQLLDNNPERVDIINAHGIKIEGISGDHVVSMKASTDPGELGEADLVLICVKAGDTSAAAKGALPVVGSETTVLTLQNGLGNVERIADVVGGEKTLGGTTAQGATLLGHGHIRHAGNGETVIGAADGSNAPMRKIADHLADCGIKVSVTDDLEGLIWSKLVINVGINALTALTRMKNGELVEHDGTKMVMAQAVNEAVEVVKGRGINLLYDDPVEKVESVCVATAANISSMLQDVLKGKRTEVAYINGAIVEEGRRLGIKTPANEILTNLVKTIEEGYGKQILE